MNLFTFENNMPGKLTPEKFKLRWSNNDVTSIHMPTSSRGRGLATDTKLYSVSKLYKNYLVENDKIYKSY